MGAHVFSKLQLAIITTKRGRMVMCKSRVLYTIGVKFVLTQTRLLR